MPDQKASGKTSWGKTNKQTNKQTNKTESQKRKEENEDVA